MKKNLTGRRVFNLIDRHILLVKIIGILYSVYLKFSKSLIWGG